MSDLMWQASAQKIKEANITAYIQYLNENKGLKIKTYQELWQWSVDHLDQFWESQLKYFNIQYSGTYQAVLNVDHWPVKHHWFKGIQLNYAEHVLQNQSKDLAILWQDENGKQQNYTFEELYNEVCKVVQYFQEIGLQKNDCVVAYTPNIPQTIITFLACNAMGLIWSSCSPDFGLKSVVDRFQQIQPKLLLAAAQYQYNGKLFDKSEVVQSICLEIKSIKYVLNVGEKALLDNLGKESYWFDIQNKKPNKISFVRSDFEHPIWVLYSSGTTGKPKAITHSVGGILLEHYKALALHQDVKKGEKFMWYSTTGWMMWNYANAALLCGAAVAIYDGSPTYPKINSLWGFVEQNYIQHFGVGAAYFANCLQKNVDLSNYNFSHLISIGATGSPLTEECYDWIYENVKKDLWLISLSGGTDICSGMVGGVPTLPVYKGEIQQRMLGVDLHALDENGNRLIDELGELVIEQAMPSMPIYFWGDENDERYKLAYFEDFKGKWRHGDWIKINKRGGVKIYGRSDSTLNRGGVRIGTAELYNAMLKVNFLEDCMVVCIDYPNGTQWMPMFVKMAEGLDLIQDRVDEIKSILKKECSPRHVPDDVLCVSDIPYTLSGKKMETPIKKLFMGKSTEKDFSKGAMKNPDLIQEYVAIKNSRT